jgi:hypothetical protein
VRVSKPSLPTPRQVAAVQDFINSRQPCRHRLLVRRTSIDVIGPETLPSPEAQVVSPEILGPPEATPFVPSVPPLPKGINPGRVRSDGQRPVREPAQPTSPPAPAGAQPTPAR